MTRRALVGCPRESCGAVFEIDERRLGRNVYCLDCGARMTARPVDVEARRRARPPASGGESAAPRLPLAGLLDDLRSLWNVGSIFRTADACGVERLLLTGITGHPPRPEIAKTALGADEVVPWRYEADPLRAVAALRDEGFTPVAVERTPAAVPLARVRWPERPCIVVGNEVAGVSPAVLDACELHVSIPMLGVKESLNVAVAFGIVAHAAASSLRRAVE